MMRIRIRGMRRFLHDLACNAENGDVSHPHDEKCTDILTSDPLL
jgi:hypothetical protein